MIKELCGKISYNAYTAVNDILFYSGAGIIIGNTPIEDPIIPYIAVPIMITQAIMWWSNYIINTKEAVQIRDLYQDFINNYNKLNDSFELESPIQIYSMFNYLLNKGYLSKDKAFEYSKKKILDVPGMLGISIVTGKGVCRHISSALNDILNSKGIQAYPLGVFDTDDKSKLKRLTGNHQITFAVYDGKSYFLDPTQSRILEVSESNKKVLHDKVGDQIVKFIPLAYINKTNFIKLKRDFNKKYPTVPKEESDILVSSTIETCKNNVDMLERFFNENKEIYEDISDKILTLRKTNKIPTIK